MINETEVHEALRKAGIGIQACSRCNKPIVWMYTVNKKLAPMTLELKNHFSDCPFADNFRKVKDKK